jgi:hypothetical protein
MNQEAIQIRAAAVLLQAMPYTGHIILAVMIAGNQRRFDTHFIWYLREVCLKSCY